MKGIESILAGEKLPHQSFSPLCWCARHGVQCKDTAWSNVVFETVPRGFIWSGGRGSQHVLTRLDWVLSFGRDP
jgi:hypothetical protein